MQRISYWKNITNEVHEMSINHDIESASHTRAQCALGYFKL